MLVKPVEYPRPLEPASTKLGCEPFFNESHMTTCLAGIDMSAQTFSVCLATSQGTESREFSNTSKGHRVQAP